MIAVLGDIHFRSDYPWFIEAAESFLSFFKKWDLNNENNVLVLTGDLVNKEVNGGLVVEYLERLANTSKFKKVIILEGNHDSKRINGVYQLAYKFLDHKNHIEIVSEPTQLRLEGLECLFLPYLTPTIEIASPTEYYSNLYKTRKSKVDIVFGHIQDKNCPGEGVSNLDKLADNICLGHIHTRMHPNYIGSLYPANYSENETKYYRTYSKENDRVILKENPLPHFLDFKVINYGDEVVNDDALTTVYVIHNCPPDHLLDSKYDNIHIKKKYRASIAKKDIKKIGSGKTTSDYFKDFLKQSDDPFNRSVVKICKDVLNI